MTPWLQRKWSRLTQSSWFAYKHHISYMLCPLHAPIAHTYNRFECARFTTIYWTCVRKAVSLYNTVCSKWLVRVLSIIYVKDQVSWLAKSVAELYAVTNADTLQNTYGCTPQQHAKICRNASFFSDAKPASASADWPLTGFHL